MPQSILVFCGMLVLGNNQKNCWTIMALN